MPQLTNTILSPTELHQFEQLRLKPRRRFAGRMRGERVSRQKGISLEFADYREYVVGDDLRHLDWNILARLGRPTIRTYQDEDDLAVYLLLDASESMNFGQPTKFATAQRLAAGLGFVGLCGQDRVTPIVLGKPPARPLLGRSSLGKLSLWCESAKIGTTPSFSAGVAAFIKSSGIRPGLVVCITDALDPSAASSIRSIGARGHEVLLIQILSNFDINPEMEGDLRLIDCEGGDMVDVTAHNDVFAQYRQNLSNHNKSIETALSTIGGRYLLINSPADLTDTITKDLRNIGVIG